MGDPGYEGETALDNLRLSRELIERSELPVQTLVTHRSRFENLAETYRTPDERRLDCMQMIVDYD